RHVDDEAAARISRLAQAENEHIAGDAKILDRPGQRKGGGRYDADFALQVDERVRIEVFRVYDRRIDIGEELEFIRAADIVAVAGRAERQDLPAPRSFSLPWA